MLQSQIDSYLIIYIIFSRVLELFLSYRNTKNLLSKGGKEYYSSHYKLIVIYHLMFVLYFLNLSITFEGINYKALYFFLLIQLCRFKVISDLGEYWTTRIIVLKNKPLITSGFYRYLRHPNYLIVLIEIILVSLVFKNYFALIIFTFIKIILLSVRIYFEEKANSNRRKKFSN